MIDYDWLIDDDDNDQLSQISFTFKSNKNGPHSIIEKCKNVNKSIILMANNNNNNNNSTKATKKSLPTVYAIGSARFFEKHSLQQQQQQQQKWENYITFFLLSLYFLFLNDNKWIIHATTKMKNFIRCYFTFKFITHTLKQ